MILFHNSKNILSNRLPPLFKTCRILETQSLSIRIGIVVEKVEFNQQIDEKRQYLIPQMNKYYLNHSLQ